VINIDLLLITTSKRTK